MDLETRTLDLQPSQGPAVRCFAASPPDRPDAPGVVVIHEVWGVDDHIRSVVERLARSGFRAIAPDLIGMEVTLPHEVFFAAFQAVRTLPPEERAVPARIAAALEATDPAWRGQVMTLMGVAMRGPTPEGLAAVDSATRWLRDAGSPRVAVLGFCMGGGYTWAYASGGGTAEAFVPFYGRLPADFDARRVKGALLGHYGSLDEGIPVPPLVAAAAAIKARGREAAIEVYEAPHAFFNDTRDTYHPLAAELAWNRTLSFLYRTLSPVT